MASYHTNPFPEETYLLMITLEENDHDLLLELMGVNQKSLPW
ncbi:hypothetical protein [Bacillus subtilis]